MDKKHYPLAALIAALVTAFAIGLGSLVTTPPEVQGPSNRTVPGAISTERYMDHVRFLASPEMQGRGNGTPELDQAGEYLAAQFRIWGLRPAGEDGTYFQTFELITGTEIGPGSELSFGERQLRAGEDFSAVRFRLQCSPVARLRRSFFSR